MVDNKHKKKFMAEPVEKHDAAAWANIDGTKPVSNVTVPSEDEVINAREWVDTNEK